MTTPNTGFASDAMTHKPGALCFYASVLLVGSFVLLNRQNTKPENGSKH